MQGPTKQAHPLSRLIPPQGPAAQAGGGLRNVLRAGGVDRASHLSLPTGKHWQAGERERGRGGKRPRLQEIAAAHVAAARATLASAHQELAGVKLLLCCIFLA